MTTGIVPISNIQTLGANSEARSFEDAAAFLRAGGQRGPQRQILREGTYAVNLALFVVLTESRVYSLPLEKAEERVLARMAELIHERARWIVGNKSIPG